MNPSPSPTRPSSDPRRGVGRRGEDIALAHLEALGYEALARNHRTRQGEIDLIVFGQRVLVFVEVKTRVLRRRPGPGPSPDSPLEGIRSRQRLRLRRLVAAWLSEQQARPSAREIRVDAIGIVLDGDGRLIRLDHVEGVL